MLYIISSRSSKLDIYELGIWRISVIDLFKTDMEEDMKSAAITNPTIKSGHFERVAAVKPAATITPALAIRSFLEQVQVELMFRLSVR